MKLLRNLSIAALFGLFSYQSQALMVQVIDTDTATDLLNVSGLTGGAYNNTLTIDGADVAINITWTETPTAEQIGQLQNTSLTTVGSNNKFTTSGTLRVIVATEAGDINLLADYGLVESIATNTSSSLTGPDSDIVFNSSVNTTDLLVDVGLASGGTNSSVIYDDVYVGGDTIITHIFDITYGTNDTFSASMTTTIDVPEPGSLAILGLGLVGLGLARWTKQKQA